MALHLPDRSRCLVLNCSCNSFTPRSPFMVPENEQILCSICSHGVHAHADIQSVIVNQFIAQECFSFVQKTAETCTCTAPLADHVPIVNPHRDMTGSYPPNNATSTRIASQQSGLSFPVYASIGVTSGWSSTTSTIPSVTLLPFSITSIPIPLNDTTNVACTPSNPTSLQPTPVIQPGNPCTPDENDRLVQYASRPNPSYRVRPYPGPSLDSRRPSERLHTLTESGTFPLRRTSPLTNRNSGNLADATAERQAHIQLNRFRTGRPPHLRAARHSRVQPLVMWICCLPLQCLHCYRYLLETDTQSLPIEMCQNTCQPRQLRVAQEDIVPSIQLLREMGLAFSLTIRPDDGSLNANIWTALHRGIVDKFGTGTSFTFAGLNTDEAATPNNCGWCLQTYYKVPASTPHRDTFRYVRAVNRTNAEDSHLESENITLSNVKRWCFRVGPNSPPDLDPFRPNRDKQWTLFIAPSNSNLHGNLSRLAQYHADLRFPYDSMAIAKRSRPHSCYADMVLSRLPFFRRTIGLDESDDLTEHPAFVQCRVHSSRPRDGLNGQPYRSLCPQNPYSEQLTDDEDEDLPERPSALVLPLRRHCDSSIESFSEADTPDRAMLNIPALEYPLSASPSPSMMPAENPHLNSTGQIINTAAVGASRIMAPPQVGPPFPRYCAPVSASEIYDAQRKVQRGSSTTVVRSKAFMIEAQTPVDAGQAIHICLSEFYRRCWDLEGNTLIEGPFSETNFAKLPLLHDRPPRNWQSFQAYTDPNLTILSSPTAEEAAGLGVNIQCHTTMIDSILSSSCYVGARFGKFKVPSLPSRIYNPDDLAIWRADGACFALYSAYTGAPIDALHPLFLLTLLPPPDSDPLRYLGDITGPLLQTLDPDLCDAIRPWFYLEPTNPIDKPAGKLDPKPHHIGLGHPRTARDHTIQTQDLLSELVVGAADFWRTEAFNQIRRGFHQVFCDSMPDLTIPQAFTDLSCGPVNAVAYLYDCEPCSPSEILQFMDISEIEPAHPHFPNLRENFIRELENFLMADILRSKALLYVLTGNKNIPRWDSNFVLKFDFVPLNSPGSIFIHSCLNSASISWDSTTEQIVAGNHPVLTPGMWLEMMFTGEAGYSMS
ncbi:hypothetical protein EV421DRAFT_1909177 [Armillaria borealis]|uniref:Uncharacterized protein n=1 Tax=Armillaria borealis TaxID=47425 RepID=A0AA39J230_9AGAR|nr:hypothetical protein EV421DRAFT_1909177 [Armillaria borealis]